jgi:type III secretion protein V
VWILERVWQIVRARTYLGTWVANKARGLSVVVPQIVTDTLYLEADQALRRAIQRTATGSYLALEPQLGRDIIAAVGRAVGPGGPDGPSRAVLLTGAEIRRYVRRLVETDLPGIAVLSFQELAPEAQIRPIARISV